MFIADLNDLVLEAESDALEELGRVTLSEGPWATVAYLVRTRREDDLPWEGPFLWLHRYQRVREGWKLVSRFRTTDPMQLARLGRALETWGFTGAQEWGDEGPGP